jgi:SAM-dependent methyltransferase
MYDFEWHKDHGDNTTTSAELIIGYLASFLDFSSVLDVGCGDGRWLSVCRAKGARVVVGVDGPWTDLTRLLIPEQSLTIQELSEPFDLGCRFGLAISLEVAEHVGEQFSNVFVDNLVRHSDIILFGAAIPFQGGFRHVNEQWQSYWWDLFNARGFGGYDVIRNQIWQNKDVHFWYKQNIILYLRKSNTDAVDRVSRYIRDKNIQQLPLDIVHPERYEASASYRQIAFRPLIKELPRQTARKLAGIVKQRM